MLGRYEVIRHLASGGMADLLLARARGLEGFERHVVIKRIRAEAEDDQAFIDMFLVEARLAAALHHHNIVQVYDIGEEHGKPYFAMEYVHGEDLRRLLATVVQKGQQIPLPVVVTIVTAVARALHHAHEQKGADQQPLGIVHRDVSPANVIVGYDGNVKVLDFGIARAAMRRTETQAGMLKGKAPYMAPEQCTGAPVDRRSDVFALGIVLYELATARRLFKGDNDHLTMMTIVNGTIPKPSTIRKDLPPDLERIILRALSRDPSSRYQTTEQMFGALEQLALTAEWRTSASVLEAYMTQIFGSRTEPWLATEPTATIINVDFDGTRPGLASVGSDVNTSAVPAAVTPTRSSPMMRARDDAQASSGVPKSADATVSAPIKIPNPSGPARSKSAAMAAAKGAPKVTATPPRGRPKTVQVPVPKADTRAKSEAKIEESSLDNTQVRVMPTAATEPAAKKIDPASFEATEVLATPPTPTAAPAAKSKADPASTETTEVLEIRTPSSSPTVTAKAAAKTELVPTTRAAAKTEAKVDGSRAETEQLPTTKAAAKTELVPSTKKAAGKPEETVDLRPATEVDAPTPLNEPEDTHTEAQALPPSISPHAPRQLRQLPTPNVAKVITPKPMGRVEASVGAAAASALRVGTIQSASSGANVSSGPLAKAESAGTPVASTTAPGVGPVGAAVVKAGPDDALAKTVPAGAAAPVAGSNHHASQNGASNDDESADAGITSPTMISNPAKAAAAALVAGADFREDVSSTATDIEDIGDLSGEPEESPFKRQSDPTAIVVPLPSPLRTDSARGRRTSSSPVGTSTSVVEDTDQLGGAPPRPRWMLAALGGGVLVLAIIIFAIASSGGDDALDAPPPETASVTEPPKPEPSAAPSPDEVRTESKPRTWANSQQPDETGSAAAADPTPVTPPTPAEGSAAALAPTDPVVPIEPPTPTEPAIPTEPDSTATKPTDPKPGVATAKPQTTKPTKPTKPAIATTKPAIAKAPKPAARPVAKPKTVAKVTKPAPKPTPKAKLPPKPKWNPNTLFPNKK